MTAIAVNSLSGRTRPDSQSNGPEGNKKKVQRWLTFSGARFRIPAREFTSFALIAVEKEVFYI